MITYLEYACALLEDEISEITFIIAAYRNTSHLYVYSDVENGGCQFGAFAEVCNELASSFLSVKQIYLHSVPLDRDAVGLKFYLYYLSNKN